MSNTNQKALPLSNVPKRRIWELDFLRGISIILMVMDHTFYNISCVFDTDWLATGNTLIIGLVNFTRYYWTMPLRTITREFVLWTLFIICGISNSFSRSNLKRGLQLAGVALIISAVTMYISQYDVFSYSTIKFGVIHMLASCILIWCVVKFIFRDPFKVAAACFVIALLVFIINDQIDYLTSDLVVNNNYFAFIHETTAESILEFSPGDYFPLIPYLGMFMIGAAIGPVIYKSRKSLLPFLDKYDWYRPVNFLGRHTLEIVVLHQPIITFFLGLISYLFVTKGNFVIF